MMVVDSSVWLAILLSQPLKERCLKEIRGKNVLIPSLCFFECYKKLRARLPDERAMEAISPLFAFEQLALTTEVALSAADLSLEHGLAMADCIVLAHARARRSTLLTLDNDFAAIAGVKVLR